MIHNTKYSMVKFRLYDKKLKQYNMKLELRNVKLKFGA